MIPNDARAIETCHTWTDDLARLVTESEGVRDALLENHGLVVVPESRIAALEAELADVKARLPKDKPEPGYTEFIGPGYWKDIEERECRWSDD